VVGLFLVQLFSTCGRGDSLFGTKPFTLAINGIGVFGGFSRPRVVWVGVREDNGNLISLHKAVETAASQIGCEPERRPFSPHLTLGRVQRKISRSDSDRIRAAVLSHETLDFGTMQVNVLRLFESKLKPTGAVYRPLFEIELS
jgi:2'-5' RNA ligase